MLEIEKFPCLNVLEATQREQQFINLYNSNLNILRAFRTEEEKIEQITKDNRTKEQLYEKGRKYNEKYRDIIKEKTKKYYEEHKEYFKEKRTLYYEENKELLAKNKKIYREKNKEKLLEISKQKYTCICGTTSCIKGKRRHEKTLKHINFVNNVVDISKK